MSAVPIGTASLTLHDDELSSDCYKVRLLLAFLGLAYVRIEPEAQSGCDLPSYEYIHMGSRVSLPVISLEDFIIGEAHAILYFLAHQYGTNTAWRCNGPVAVQSQIIRWLAFAGELRSSAGIARLHDTAFVDADIERCRYRAHSLLRTLDEHLWFVEQEGGSWLCPQPEPSIADIACFPDVMLCEEGGIARLEYPAVRRWTDRVKRIPGFVGMPGIFGLPRQ
jgi:glutathione S-transferase